MKALTDAHVARFITDGYLVLNAGVASAVHETIYRKLAQVLNEEGNPGNNILPAVPELQQILDSPTVQGALTGVLGPNYVLHPHRFVHNNEPGKRTEDGGKVGEGSRTFIGWHQDDHSPLARPRHHYPRYAMLLYYPQDTPPEMGPTQIIPATHLHRRVSDADRERGFQASGPQGTCLLVHFDLAHGGSLNIAERTRYMAKFVFARTEEPTAPSWDSQRTEWETPAEKHAPQELPVVWNHLWNWLRGQPQTPPEVARNFGSFPAALRVLETNPSTGEAIAAINAMATYGPEAAEAIPLLLSALEGEELVRQSALYALAAIGSPAVEALCADLRNRTESGWNEGAVVMENSAYALAATGRPAVSGLVSLLENPSEWVQINALFALGEMGTAANPALPALISSLASSSHAVVRTALDALGQIGATPEEALPALRSLLCESRPDWQTPLRRGWTAQDQVRTNAAMALLCLHWQTEEATRLLAASLSDSCGYVTGFGVETLLRQNTPASLRAALHSLQAHRWDDSLQRNVRTF